MKKIKRSQRVRVIVDNISFYSDVKRICQGGVGDFSEVNRAIFDCFKSLERFRQAEPACTGHAGHWNGYSVQIDLV